MFRQDPCRSRRELFDREEELNQLVKALKSNVWVAILGPRMAGKTSLAYVGANLLEDFSVVYVDLRGTYTMKKAAERILNSLPQSKLESLLERIKGIRIGKFGIELKDSSAVDVMERLFSELHNGIVILDEVQDVIYGVNHFLNLLARIRNSKRDINFVFTGSSIGLMRSLLEPSPKSPLYGRTPIKIELKPWDFKTAYAFLEKGLRECNVDYTGSEISETINELGTLPGWLNFYGLRRCLGKSHEKALEESTTEGVKVAKMELENLLKNRPAWARLVLRSLAFGARWHEMLELGASKAGLLKFLKTLQNLYLISKEGEVYRISDPIYRRASREL